MQVDMKYQAGLLCFREGPVVVNLYREFANKRPDIKLDLILTDGSGEWHPRGCGLSSFVGDELKMPVVGVFKNFLKIGSDYEGDEVVEDARLKCKNFGDYIVLDHVIKNGTHVRCAVMKTMNTRNFDPIYITPGNLCDFDSAIRIVKSLCKQREPEPLRLADRISRKYIDEKTNRFRYTPG